MCFSGVTIFEPVSGNLNVFHFTDEEAEPGADNEEEKELVTILISNGVHFTNPKMSWYVLDRVIVVMCVKNYFLLCVFFVPSVWL